MSKIHYQIFPDNTNDHLFSVSLSFTSKVQQSYQLSLPAWLPGSYMIRDFAKNIVQICGKNAEGDPLILHKTDKQTWQVNANDEQVVILYQVYAFDLSVRSAYLDEQRGFFNGSSVFLAIEELKTQPCQLTIHSPEKKPDWRVATGLTRTKNTEKYSFGEYIAEDYFHLIDCPVEMGNFDAFEFIVEGVTHHMIFAGAHFGDRQRISQDVAKLCQHHIHLFGEAPFKEYWFITNLVSEGFGGLEHKNSTILQASRFDLPNPNKPEELTDNYKTFLSLCSHEYFHAWNVCRIKPKEFVPYDLQQEVYTTQLWAYEGITSYYDDFSLYRVGIISFEDYLAILSKTITRVYRGDGELKQSVTESSYYTWTKFYQQGEDAVNNIVSYYTKGSLIALWLDLTIREKSKGQYSLDTLMRELWIHFGRTSIGTQQDDYINIVNILCGEDISEDFLTLLNIAERVDLAPLLNKVGVDFSPAKFKKINSLDTCVSDEYIVYLGAMYKELPQGLKITQVVANSPAAQAGIAVNDVLIAVNSLKVTSQSLQNLADHLPANKQVSCHYFRDDQLMISTLSFCNSPTIAINLTAKNEGLLYQWQDIIA
ncbi:MAG: M61 family metallopeptidase [Alteromonadaceae bacterium]|nr:M61 family metallopeptidase [Alteromonadaceae bacterium]